MSLGPDNMYCDIPFLFWGGAGDRGNHSRRAQGGSIPADHRWQCPGG